MNAKVWKVHPSDNVIVAIKNLKAGEDVLYHQERFILVDDPSPGNIRDGLTTDAITTGLGTPTGNPVCPVIKVSSNNDLTKRMSDLIDINTGAIIEGEKTIEEMGIDILEYCIKAASGEVIPKAVLLNQDDFIPWKRGVSL